MIVIVGTVVSITKFLLDASAFESSSAGKVNVALFPAASFMVPLFKASALVL